MRLRFPEENKTTTIKKKNIDVVLGVKECTVYVVDVSLPSFP